MNEQFVNNAVGALGAAVDETATSIVVLKADLFPTDPQFRVQVDNELMLVTAIGGSDFTVERGHEGTIAEPHGAGAVVTFVVTAEVFNGMSGGPFNPLGVERLVMAMPYDNYTGNDVDFTGSTSTSGDLPMFGPPRSLTPDEYGNLDPYGLMTSAEGGAEPWFTIPDWLRHHFLGIELDVNIYGGSEGGPSWVGEGNIALCGWVGDPIPGSPPDASMWHPFTGQDATEEAFKVNPTVKWHHRIWMGAPRWEPCTKFTLRAYYGTTSGSGNWVKKAYPLSLYLSTTSQEVPPITAEA